MDENQTDKDDVADVEQGVTAHPGNDFVDDQTDNEKGDEAEPDAN